MSWFKSLMLNRIGALKQKFKKFFISDHKALKRDILQPVVEKPF